MPVPWSARGSAASVPAEILNKFLPSVLAPLVDVAISLECKSIYRSVVAT